MSQPSATAARLKGMIKNVGKTNSAVNALAPGSAPHNAGIQHGSVLNCYKATHDYVDRMVSSVAGMKSLVLDTETTSIVGLVFTQSDLIAKDVFLVECVNVVADAMVEERNEEMQMRAQLRKGAIMKGAVGVNEQSMQHLTAIAFLQPNAVTLDKLEILLKSPRYKDYHIFFSNILPGGFLEALADKDPLQRIKSVHEYYADYFAVAPSLFHFNADSTHAIKAIQENTQFSSKASWMYDRDFQGLLSVMLSLKRRPDIRYMAGSDLCKRLAMDLVHTMNEEQDLFTFNHAAPGDGPTMLLLLDRKDDVVTPLLSQWTYQAMVHELLGITMNRIHLSSKHAPKVDPAKITKAGPKSPEEKAADALRDVVLSSEQDAFFHDSMFVNFGELGIRVKRLVADFQQATKTQIKLESIDDMQRFVDNYPQFALQSGTVSRHVSVMGEISKVVNARKLLVVSAVEQELVCGTEHNEGYEKLLKLCEDPTILFLDKLRATMLYALRYDNQPNHLPILKGHLRAHARVSGYSETVLEFIDKVLSMSYGHTRTWPLFSDSDGTAAGSLKSVVKSIATNVKGIDNIYTQHKGIIVDILSHAMNGELKTVQFPFAESGSVKTIYRRILVFVVGGVTYEEFASVEALMQSPRYRGNFTTLVGGSCIHNSASFLREMGDLESYKLSKQQTHETHTGAETQSSQPYRPQYQAASSQPARTVAASVPAAVSASAIPHHEEYDDFSPTVAPPRYNGAAGPPAPRPAPAATIPPATRGPSAAGAGVGARPPQPAAVNTRPMQPGAAMRGPPAGAGAGQPGSARPAGPGRPMPRSSSGSLGLGE